MPRNSRVNAIADCIEQGANVNERIDYNNREHRTQHNTPILQAIEYPFSDVIDVISKLIELRADATARNDQLDNLLHRAASKDIVSILDFVHSLTDEFGRKLFAINSRNYVGATPLMLAVMLSNNQVIARLIQMGADVNLTDSLGHNLFHYAACRKRDGAIDYVYNNVYSPNVRDSCVNVLSNHQMTPIMLTAFHSNSAGIQALLIYGANVNQQAHSGTTALHEAIKLLNVNRQSVQILVDAGANIDRLDMHGNTPLSMAIQHDLKHLDNINYDPLEIILHRSRAEYLHSRRLRALWFIFLETLPIIVELKAMVAAYIANPDWPVIVAMIFDDNFINHHSDANLKIIARDRIDAPTQRSPIAPLQRAHAYDAACHADPDHVLQETRLHELRAQHLENQMAERLDHLWQARPIFDYRNIAS